jgi:uncharacterized Ntn-hydrolase superfamily protein
MRALLLSALCFVSVTSFFARQSQFPPLSSSPAVTCTLAAWDSTTGDLGVTVYSQLLACGALIPYARAGAGLFAVQGVPDPMYAAEGWNLLAQGLNVRQILDSLTALDARASEKNICAIDAGGFSAVFTGAAARPAAVSLAGNGYCVLVDGFPGADMPGAMGAAFQNTKGGLAEKLLSALDAADRVMGKRTRFRSASLLVVRKNGGYGEMKDRYIDLRVDNDSLPLVRLHQGYAAWETTYLPDAEWQLVERLNADRKFDAARAMLKQIVAGLNEELRRKPDDPATLCRIARALATHDLDRERALELIIRADKISPGIPGIMDVMGECYYRLGRFDEAIAVAARMVAQDPTNDYYQNRLQKFRTARQQLNK